ncbi:MAG: hypoxanthine phosphoribosyltransferase [Elusimicrobia bacterium]|nr:hypoxanthine phosphoribosyltransferase [Elusimicrobiota bacterium]MDE2425083.1 hypoxanthine phosphoribosyltransferase [Elusimicrobiota bacterium]
MLKTAPTRGIDRVLLDEETLRQRIKELGARISADYAGKPLLLVGILRGSIMFMGELMKSIAVDCAIDFMSLSSYAGDSTTGNVRVLLDLRGSCEGRDVLVVEDIIDTGLTLDHLLALLRTRQPRSLEVCSLLDKPSCRKVDVTAKYVGFPIADDFVVGFGLDYNERYRNLPYVGVLKRP